MHSPFITFVQLGFDHILDLNGYDHILFLVALCAVYTFSAWKKVALLATAFTIGHSLTLALSALGIVRFPGEIIEFLIPVTILLTAIYNVMHKNNGTSENQQLIRLNYLFALAFGLVHGMGFSNFFRSSLMPGEEGQLLTQLLAFNIGVELGQLVIVGLILGISYVAFNILKTKQREWVVFVSGAAAGVALVLMLETKFW
ncbi:MAG: HupE/UreJ family protein [Lewinellaceae bacterium]|nr:HupE/UreJ family protein [Saprospiraceae bacterium]MCB9341319.1 HupE/UreJ family protein [Lewinellaceae bacterium]